MKKYSMYIYGALFGASFGASLYYEVATIGRPDLTTLLTAIVLVGFPFWLKYAEGGK